MDPERIRIRIGRVEAGEGRRREPVACRLVFRARRLQPVAQGHQLVDLGHNALLLGKRRERDRYARKALARNFLESGSRRFGVDFRRAVLHDNRDEWRAFEDIRNDGLESLIRRNGVRRDRDIADRCAAGEQHGPLGELASLMKFDNPSRKDRVRPSI